MHAPIVYKTEPAMPIPVHLLPEDPADVLEQPDSLSAVDEVAMSAAERDLALRLERRDTTKGKRNKRFRGEE